MLRGPAGRPSPRSRTTVSNFLPIRVTAPSPPATSTARIGIGFAELVCTDLADIRDAGTISIAGTRRPGGRSSSVGRELPPRAAASTVGDETWTVRRTRSSSRGSRRRPAARARATTTWSSSTRRRPPPLLHATTSRRTRSTLIDVGRDGETVRRSRRRVHPRANELGKLEPARRDRRAHDRVPGGSTCPVSGRSRSAAPSSSTSSATRSRRAGHRRARRRGRRSRRARTAGVASSGRSGSRDPTRIGAASMTRMRLNGSGTTWRSHRPPSRMAGSRREWPTAAAARPDSRATMQGAGLRPTIRARAARRG